jgi:hypothetical protein
MSNPSQVSGKFGRAYFSYVSQINKLIRATSGILLTFKRCFTLS